MKISTDTEHLPKKCLFEGQLEETNHSDRSLEAVLKKSIRLAKINKPLTLHWLVHSFANHLLKSSTDLRYIQKLLEPNSCKTIGIYIYVGLKSLKNIKTTFDDL